MHPWEMFHIKLCGLVKEKLRQICKYRTQLQWLTLRTVPYYRGRQWNAHQKGFPKGIYLACTPSKILNQSVIISSHFASEVLNVKLHSDIRHTFHTKEGEYSSSVSCSLICWARNLLVLGCTKRDVSLPHSVLWTERTSESLSSPPFLFCSQHTILAS